ncbi:hypothetical protein FOZ62_006622 [Perkinsus olseni]|uniref:Uncharacterized protein n=1 Tax=Perkinsus olseni TaxID=32597 RepID=A0A7J6PWS2_PEROL|nr:hypothetical protein FOZ62_006622 [Perkinsus olseni]
MVGVDLVKSWYDARMHKVVGFYMTTSSLHSQCLRSASEFPSKTAFKEYLVSLAKGSEHADDDGDEIMMDSEGGECRVWDSNLRGILLSGDLAKEDVRFR